MAAAGVEDLQMKSEQREIDGAYFFVLPSCYHTTDEHDNINRIAADMVL